jgi:hypothetical protein
MLAWCHFLFPCLHFSLFGESICFQHTVYDSWKLSGSWINIINLANEAFDARPSVIAI